MIKNTYAMKVVLLYIAVLFLLVCSFIVSLKKIDLLYLISVIIFSIKFIRLK